MSIRTATYLDIPIIHSLNESVIPHVNRISMPVISNFLSDASFFKVIEVDGNIVAFMIVFGPKTSYKSENYIYFKEYYRSFDYVDRIVVDKEFQNKGIGKKLYNFLFDHSKEKRVTCEVNIDPPNPRSINFHQTMGFEQLEHRPTEDGKIVSMMVRNKI